MANEITQILRGFKQGHISEQEALHAILVLLYRQEK